MKFNVPVVDKGVTAGAEYKWDTQQTLGSMNWKINEWIKT